METISFEVGQKVICINDEGRDASWMGAKHFPIKGRVYTVAAMHDCHNGMAVGVNEIPNDQSSKVPPYAFHINRFVAI